MFQSEIFHTATTVLALALVLALAAAPAHAHAHAHALTTLQSTDCIFTAASSGISFNVTSLFAAPFNVSLAINNHPPSYDSIVLYGNPCHPLPVVDTLPREDQCPDKTSLCIITTNFKAGVPRVTRVVAFASSDIAPKIDLSGPLSLTGSLGLLYVGANTTVELIVHCKKDSTPMEPPKVTVTPQKSTVEWTDPSGCAVVKTIGSGSSSMSATGFFFTFLFVGLFAYFVVGMVYNYAVLNIRRFPEILPHHELWIALASSIMDLFGSLWSRITGGSSNRYVAL